MFCHATLCFRNLKEVEWTPVCQNKYFFSNVVSDASQGPSILSKNVGYHWMPVFLPNKGASKYLLFVFVSRGADGRWCLCVRTCAPEIFASVIQYAILFSGVKFPANLDSF